MAYQNRYLIEHGENHDIPPMLSAQNTWTRETILECIKTILQHGRPEPPRLAVVCLLYTSDAADDM
eukprot:6429493-Alexandrium_andersonii.AAC.1